ncbi:ribulose-phosphate 3-epimerase [Tuwongella immobilis]|uniref:Ribulose-phosphate 3-epimerase n=1 Tax=Tuwongella immobilis TaxID=692036 RepID=A0A6C2YJM5_9BACT|nr:ribulose-phosphate 3-epimerase [Tuwongella immobilis]VIP01577.1 ribulose-phosphate 3-epimerase : Ribulose-phosphate 3-epimerase OS=Geobacillus sp. JF8 GN=M493_05980 PE=3 SV=1: Ribul_P_3_epim [Tuwongella immobilis]VTR98821.1 ribulose-phosphate 3-epimerase : Ribulose-phosphate 3-epimerase OS=Geobacillus sp. JF8 GN=M493_05980 PE=3 SV=1: Ribul_P_3_epim [Tuwongella immobilis]
MTIAVAPSILAADFSRLGELVRTVQDAGADRIHVDVMDGHFVPNLSMGPVVVKGLRPITSMPLEVHLMVERPNDFIPAFVSAGANSLIIHEESADDSLSIIRDIRARGVKVGLAIKPRTPIDVIVPYLNELDLVLCMTVEPGFGGQAFLPESIERILNIRKLIEQNNPTCELEVDGGIDARTAILAVKAGANVLVAGTAIFGAEDGPAAATRAMRDTCIAAQA